MNRYLVLLLTLPACAPTWGGSLGSSSGRFAAPGATCVVTSATGTAAQSFITKGAIRENLYGIPTYSQFPTGISECVIHGGERVQVYGNGYRTGTKKVASVDGRCSGDVQVAYLGQCQGGRPLLSSSSRGRSLCLPITHHELMPKAARHHHIKIRRYRTADGRQRQIYEIRLVDWKGVWRRFASGDYLPTALMKILLIAVVMLTLPPVFAENDVVWQIAPPYSLMPGGSSQEGAQTPKDHMPDDEKEQAQTQDPQKNAGEDSLLKTQPRTTDSHSTHQQSKRDVDPDESPSGWSIAAVITFAAMILGLFFAGYQAWYAKRAVTLAEQSMANTADSSLIEQKRERAYLAVERWQVLKEYKGGPLTLTCVLHNTGRTPATLAEYDVHVDLRKELPPIPDYRKLPEAGLRHITINAGRDITVKAPGPSHPDVPPERIEEALDTGKVTLYFYGCFAYTDVFGHSHEVAFCTRYDPAQDVFLVVTEDGYNYST